MPEYKVETIGEQEEWSNDHGTFIGYSLQVSDSAGNLHTVKQNKKPDSPPPTVGQVLEANIVPTKNPTKPPILKVVSNQDGGGGGGGGKGRSPEDTRAMSRSAAQDRALAYMQVKATMGALKAFKPSDLVPLIEWFQADVNQYAQGEQPKSVHGLPVRNEVARTGAPDTVTPSADYPAPEPVGSDVPFGDAA